MCRLLMVEDNEIDQLIMDRMIKHYDLFHHKESKLNARSAIDEIEMHRFDDEKLPDIIFLDLTMPDFDGFDFLEKFQNLYSQINKTIDIFVVTASIDRDDIYKAQSFPFVKDVLIKPVKSALLAGLYARYKEVFSIDKQIANDYH